MHVAFHLSPTACLHWLFFPVSDQAVRQCNVRPAFQLAFEPFSSCLLAPVDLDAALTVARQKAHNSVLKGKSCSCMP